MKTYSYIFSVIKHGESIDWDDIVLPSKVFTSLDALKLGIIRHGEELAPDYAEDYHNQDIIVHEFRQASERVAIDPDCGYLNLYIDCMDLILVIQRCELVHVTEVKGQELLSS